MYLPCPKLFGPTDCLELSAEYEKFQDWLFSTNSSKKSNGSSEHDVQWPIYVSEVPRSFSQGALISRLSAVQVEEL